MIIDRYLKRQVVRPFLFVCFVLVLVFAGYSSSIFLGAASEGVIPRNAIARLIALKTMIAMEVLLPISLYLTVVVGLGRLYENLEMTALRACGFGTSRVLRAVLGVVVPVAVLTGLLSIYIRPWAYAQTYLLQAQAQDHIDLSHLEAERFYFDSEGDRVLFVDEVEQSQLKGVFLSIGSGDSRQILSAKTGRIETDDAEGEQVLILEEVHVNGSDSGPYSVAELGRLKLHVGGGDSEPGHYRRKETPTSALIDSSKPVDIAELQWRLSRPLSTFFLGLLAVFLSHTDPRRGRYAKVFNAALIYVVYYGTSIIARSWVKRGDVGAFPGMWWVDFVLGVIVTFHVVRAIRSAGEGRPK